MDFKVVQRSTQGYENWGGTCCRQLEAHYLVEVHAGPSDRGRVDDRRHIHEVLVQDVVVEVLISVVKLLPGETRSNSGEGESSRTEGCHTYTLGGGNGHMLHHLAESGFSPHAQQPAPLPLGACEGKGREGPQAGEGGAPP